MALPHLAPAGSSRMHGSPYRLGTTRVACTCQRLKNVVYRICCRSRSWRSRSLESPHNPDPTRLSQPKEKYNLKTNTRRVPNPTAKRRQSRKLDATCTSGSSPPNLDHKRFHTVTLFVSFVFSGALVKATDNAQTVVILFALFLASLVPGRAAAFASILRAVVKGSRID